MDDIFGFSDPLEKQKRFERTGLPLTPDVEKAFLYFDQKIDEAADGKSLRDREPAYAHWRVHVKAAAILGEANAGHDLVIAFLLKAAQIGKPPTPEQENWMKQAFTGRNAGKILENWRTLNDPHLQPPAASDSEEIAAYISRLIKAARPFQEASLAFHAAAVETLIGDERLLLSKAKDPKNDRLFVDESRMLTGIFYGANSALRARLGRDCDKMDEILIKAGSPPGPRLL